MLTDARLLLDEPFPLVRQRMVVKEGESQTNAAAHQAGEAGPLLHHTIAPIDLQERDDRYIVYVNTDRCSPEDFSVALKNGMVTVEYLHQPSEKAETGTYWRNRSGCTGFSFGFLLPPDADDEIHRHYHKDGLLTVIVRKREN